MKSFLKYLGPIMLLIGTGILAYYYFNTSPENTLLVAAGILMVVGLFTHVIVNKFIQE